MDQPCTEAPKTDAYFAGGALRRVLNLWLVILFACTPLGVIVWLVQQRLAEPTITLVGTGQNQHFLAGPLSSLDRTALMKLQSAGDILPKVFTVHIMNGKVSRDAPPLLGSYVLTEAGLVFQPRFPLQPGKRYQARFRLSLIPNKIAGKREDVSALLVAPRADSGPRATVQHVYPSAGKLPENQLKFYIHFSKPMSRGDSYQYVHLLTAAGKEVEKPFLELGEELWDPDMKRFTLFFDPGRVKRGLTPREEMGAPLEEGKTYTLVIDQAWPDADGNPMQAPFRKTFTVTAPDDRQPDPKVWRLQAPTANTRAPLIVRFPEPLDHALLQRLLTVRTDKDQPLDGEVTITSDEMQWEFRPNVNWHEGAYRLVVDTTLEDLAGNNLKKPFEIDTSRQGRAADERAFISLPFGVGK